MPKVKITSGKCQYNCKEGFTVFKSGEEISKILSKFPYIKPVKSSKYLVGKTKRQYHLLTCEKLRSDGTCDILQENAPAWCQTKKKATAI